MRDAPSAGLEAIASNAAVAVEALVRAFRYAADAQVPTWELAIEVRILFDLGLTLCDLRWLLHRGFALHAEESTPAGSARRVFRNLAPTEFPPGTCVVLTSAGMQAFEPAWAIRGPESAASPGRLYAAAGTQFVGGESVNTSVATRPECSPLGPWDMLARAKRPVSAGDGSSLILPKQPTALTTRPIWDRHVRELYLGEELVKRFRVPANNQQTVLDVFQEEGWPPVIDDPLPPCVEECPTRRLQATIRSLNRNRISETLRFFGNGSGEAIGWESRR
jgi:hypothetical protein